jgi:hypothetical protein
MSATVYKILFFTIGGIPTAAEQRQIDALETLLSRGYSVEVRNSDQSALYGANLEDCDFVAGNVPAEYLDIPSFGIYDNGTHAVFMEVFPPMVFNLQATHTKALQVIKKTGETVDNVVHLDTTAALDYLSDDTDVATVHATSGVVTGVAPGSCNISATLGGSLAVSLCPITVVAHIS